MIFRRFCTGIFGVLCASLTLVGAENGGATAVKVVVDTVKTAAEASPKRYIGVLEAVRRADLVPRVTGELRKIHFQEGGEVREGELLYEIEDTTYQASVHSLEAELERNLAALRFAESTFRRNQELVKSHAVSETLFDEALLNLETSRAAVKQTDALLADARNTLGYTKIYAPISGRIGKSSQTAGNLITAMGGKLSDIEQAAPIYVKFSISERVLRRDFGSAAGVIEHGRVHILLADGTLYPESAKIALADNKISVAANTMTMWALFANADRKLIPGGFVTVLLSRSDDRKLPAVPPSALITGETGRFVYVLDAENRVAARRVETGGMAGELQIVVSGLDGSERIVVDGTHKAAPGVIVIPVAPEDVR